MLLPEVDQVDSARLDRLQPNAPVRARTTIMAPTNSSERLSNGCIAVCLLCACVIATSGCLLYAMFRQG